MHAFALLAAVAFAEYLTVFASLHVLLPNYNLLQRTVSDYANSKYGRVYSGSLWAVTAGLLCLVLALRLKLGLHGMTTRAFMYLLIAVLGRVLVVHFRTDPDGQRKTRRGRLHYASAVVTFAFTFMGISVLTPVLSAQAPWHPLAGPLLLLARSAGVGLAAVAIAMVVKRLRRAVFGLCERVFLVSTDVWFVVVALALVWSH